MSEVLVLKSAVTGAASVSNKLVGEFVQQLRERDPSAAIVTRDLGADTVPHLLPETVAGIRATAQTATEKAALAQFDARVDELREKEQPVIGPPMYNFVTAAALKPWFAYNLPSATTVLYIA